MTPKQFYEKVEELVYQASRLAAEQRAAFLDQVCAGDAELRSEVASLLIFHNQTTDNFFDPLTDLVAQQLIITPRPNSQLDPLSTSPVDPLLGRTLGDYIIRAECGMGGFGAV